MKFFFYFCILIVFFTGSFTRFYTISDHFTHPDDINIIKQINDAKKSNVIENLYDPEHTNYDKKYKKTLRKHLDQDKHGFSLKILESIYPYIVIPLYTSLAPLQFFFTTPLLAFAETYEEFKFFGRLPSLIFSLLSFPVFFFISKILFQEKKLFLTLISTSLFFLSWEYIILSDLAHNYVLGVFSLTIILYTLLKQKLLFNKSDHIFEGLKLGSLLGFFVYAHYQILFILPVFMATMIWNIIDLKDINDKIKSFKYVFFSSIFAALISLPAVIWILMKKMSSINWPAGPNGEFLFNWNLFFESYLYLPKFFIKNFYILTSRMLSFVSENFYYFDLIFIFIFLLIPIGLISLLFDNNFKKKVFGRFAICLFIAWFFYTLTLNFTLSPTRQSVILLPILCILCVKGFESLLIFINNKIFKINNIVPISSVITSLIIIILFYFSFSNVMKDRIDLFNEDQFVSLVDKYNVKNILLYDGNLANLFLMPKLSKKNINIFYMHGPWPRLQQNKNFVMNENTNNLLFTSYMYPINKSEVAHNFISNDLQGWDIVYSYEKNLPAEIEFSNLTNNFANSIYIYIYSK